MSVLPVVRTLRYTTPYVLPAVRTCYRFVSNTIQVLGAPALARPAVGHTTLRQHRARRHSATGSTAGRPE
ncbi:hypothetical protein [Streptomyces sp. CT34]|uniref:hypothetical protein n=1 Tax=Streptomyces sp. CT34 TaxID=1553907 RepID=UPI000A76FC81|nr:hypothetical protein [Streptomyces sp. CT34]